eukprot:5702513-Pyramimonas_sp.AAC.1
MVPPPLRRTRPATSCPQRWHSNRRRDPRSQPPPASPKAQGPQTFAGPSHAIATQLRRASQHPR